MGQLCLIFKFLNIFFFNSSGLVAIPVKCQEGRAVNWNYQVDSNRIPKKIVHKTEQLLRDFSKCLFIFLKEKIDENFINGYSRDKNHRKHLGVMNQQKVISSYQQQKVQQQKLVESRDGPEHTHQYIFKKCKPTFQRVWDALRISETYYWKDSRIRCGLDGMYRRIVRSMLLAFQIYSFILIWILIKLYILF